MKITRLVLRNFRSYERQELTLGGGLVAIVGPNGSGKTNLVEATHLALQGFALRTRRDAAVIRFGCESAKVSVEGCRAGRVAFAVSASVDGRGRKELLFDGGRVSGADDLRRDLPTLAFTPDRLAVVKGGPIVRRTYLDRMIGRLYPARSAVPVEYGRALAQRNASLRRIRAGLSSREALAPWDASLVHAACELDAIRGEAVTALGPLFHEMGERLGLPGSTLEYEPSPISDDSLVSRLDRDLERGTTGAGPHLAELAISAAGRDLRAFGSQGEQRLAVLALLLAEAHLLGAVRGDPPLLLLDDVLSELDDDRRAALLASAPVGSQALVTATTLRAFPASAPQPDQIVDVVPGKATSR